MWWWRWRLHRLLAGAARQRQHCYRRARKLEAIVARIGEENAEVELALCPASTVMNKSER